MERGGTALGRCVSEVSLHLKGYEPGLEAGGSGKEWVCLSGACRAPGQDGSEFWGLGGKKGREARVTPQMFSLTDDRCYTGWLDTRGVDTDENSPDWSVPVGLTLWARKGRFKKVTGDGELLVRQVSTQTKATML